MGQIRLGLLISRDLERIFGHEFSILGLDEMAGIGHRIWVSISDLGLGFSYGVPFFFFMWSKDVESLGSFDQGVKSDGSRQIWVLVGFSVWMVIGLCRMRDIGVDQLMIFGL